MGPLQLILQKAEQTNTDPDVKDIDGRTPLFRASYNGHDAIVKLLISENVVLASVDIALGLTPLLGAAMKGHDGVMKLLLPKDKTLSKSKDAFGRTPLSMLLHTGMKPLSICFWPLAIMTLRIRTPLVSHPYYCLPREDMLLFSISYCGNTKRKMSLLRAAL
jgi:hypothetical protein